MEKVLQIMRDEFSLAMTLSGEDTLMYMMVYTVYIFVFYVSEF